MLARTTLVLFLVLLVSCAAHADGRSKDLRTTKDLHAPFTKLLAAHVKDGAVDYAGLSKKRKELRAYLANLAVEDVAKLPKAGRLAYWINAYNAFTLELILRHYPGVKSIRDLEKPWDTREWKAAGRTVSLNGIEHEILRKEFHEPRIHFAIVCASVSCPDLRAEAFTAEKLEEQLADATRTFLRNPKKGFRRPKKDEDPKEVFVSALFDWFGEDFVKGGGTVLDYIRPHLAEDDRKWLAANRGDLEVESLHYDWSLNGE